MWSRTLEIISKLHRQTLEGFVSISIGEHTENAAALTLKQAVFFRFIFYAIQSCQQQFDMLALMIMSL